LNENGEYLEEYLEERDGWMLIESPKMGPLLQELQDDTEEEESDDD